MTAETNPEAPSRHTDLSTGLRHLRPRSEDHPLPAVSVGRPRWRSRYAGAVIAADIAAVTTSSALYAFWGNASTHDLLLIGGVVIVLTGITLLIARAWEPAVLGQGSLEFTRLLHGMTGAAVTVGLVSLALQIPQGRPWVFGVLPIAGVLAIGGRLILRLKLHRRRLAGGAIARVLAVGTEESIANLIQRTRRAPHHGWAVAGACTPTGAGRVEGVHVLGDLDAVATLARSGDFDTISVGQAPGWTTKRLQRLVWDLEGSHIELLVDPGLMEVAGTRLQMTNVDGSPLLRLTHSSFAGAPQLLKGIIDRLAALLLLVLFAPLLIGLAVAVRRGDGGPIFFWQTRVGLGGAEFRMVKFRSMVVDAETRLAELHALDEGAGPLFKLRHDPRVTAVGRVLRRYSLDELPQLLNVLTGSMSLVGPRPPLPCEVASYASDARRRLLVKPGMTGLWQVSGRSNLSWEETVRLDLRYVETWTLALDAEILLRTARAALKGRGAY